MAKNLDSGVLLDYYGGLLSEKQRRLFTLYYDDDLSLAEIAELEQVSRQGVRDMLKRTEQRLLFLEEELGLYHRHMVVEQYAAKLQQSLQQMEQQPLPQQAQATVQELKQLTAELIEQV